MALDDVNDFERPVDLTRNTGPRVVARTLKYHAPRNRSWALPEPKISREPWVAVDDGSVPDSGLDTLYGDFDEVLPLTLLAVGISTQPTPPLFVTFDNPLPLVLMAAGVSTHPLGTVVGTFNNMLPLTLAATGSITNRATFAQALPLSLSASGYVGVGVNFAPNLYTQALGVTFDTTTGRFAKPLWYFGNIAVQVPRRFAIANPAVADFKPLTAGQLTTALLPASLKDKQDPVIELLIGHVYAGSFVVPAKNWFGTLVIRSGSLAAIPSAIDGGITTRVWLGDAVNMATITQNSSSLALKVLADAADVWVEGVDLKGAINNSILAMVGNPSLGVNAVGKIPQRIAFVHNVFDGSALSVALRGLSFDADDVLIAGNCFTRWRGAATEAQCLYCPGFCIGRHDIVNNTLDGGAENLFYGGSDTFIAGVEIWPADMHIARNWIFSPASDVGVYQKKTSFEIKKGERFSIYGNVVDGSWADAQDGYAFQVKDANQGGASVDQRCRDVTIRYNIIRNCGGMLLIQSGGGHPVNNPLARVEFRDNLGYDLNSATFALASGKGVLLSTVGTLDGPGTSISVRHNTASQVRNSATAAIYTGQTAAVVPFPLFDDVTLQDNIVPHSTYGYMKGDGTGEGEAVANGGRWASATVSKNLMHGNTAVAALYPSQYVVASEAAVGYTNLAARDFSIPDGTTHGAHGTHAASDDASYPSGKAQGADVAQVMYHTAGVV